VPIEFISSFALKLSNVRLVVKGWLPAYLVVQFHPAPPVLMTPVHGLFHGSPPKVNWMALQIVLRSYPRTIRIFT
jgi:hypothetical protein